ncbi:MAG: hypothetical protein ACAI35_10075 [Candidatus Methylacidiphilales bacterium]
MLKPILSVFRFFPLSATGTQTEPAPRRQGGTPTWGEIAFFAATLVAIGIAGWYYGFVIPAQEEQARFAQFDRHEAILLQREEAAQLKANTALRLRKVQAGLDAGER